MKKFLLVSTALVGFAAGAQAADLGAPRSPVAAAVVAPAFNWTGFYLGAHAGYGWNNYTLFNGPGAGSGNGPLLGGQIGFNYQINQFVLGAEADLAYAAISGRPVAAPGFSVRTTMLGSVRARAGFAVDRALLYVTGGLGIQNASVAFNLNAANVRFTRTGWTLGAGVEYALTQNWTAKIEYSYYNFGTSGAIPVYNFQVRSNIHTVKLGVNYLFSTGPSAVVARY